MPPERGARSPICRRLREGAFNQALFRIELLERSRHQMSDDQTYTHQKQNRPQDRA